MMYGKIFESLFTGSMVGAGSHVFATWGYVIANTKPDSHVELNPVILAAILGESVEQIEASIDYLCSPDPRSRSKEEEGRRLVKVGEFLYRVPTYEHYHNIRTNEERRDYFRVKKQEQRERDRLSKDASKTVKDLSPLSTHTDTDTDADSPLRGDVTVAALISAWNESGLPKILSVTDARKHLIKTRIKDQWWRENYITGIDRAKKSKFCRGEGGKGWRISIDFFLKPGSLAKIMEGQYDDKPENKNGAQHAAPGSVDVW